MIIIFWENINKLCKTYFSDIKLMHLYAKHIFQQRFILIKIIYILIY